MPGRAVTAGAAGAAVLGVCAAVAAAKVGSASVVSVAGLGAIAIGMTERQAERAGGIALTGTGSGPGCRYVRPADRAVRAELMLTGGRIARVDLVERGLRTSGGVRVGDSDASVRRRFANLRVEPAKYVVGGFFEEVPPRGRGDRNRRLIFETDGKRVTYVRAGRLPEVRWVERCG